MPKWVEASSLPQFEQWAADYGVEIELLGDLGGPNPLTLSWVHRLNETQAGRGREVIEGFLALADKHRQVVELVSIGGTMEEYYASMGFLSQLSTRDEETNDIGMIRDPKPHALPVLQIGPPRRGRSPA